MTSQTAAADPFETGFDADDDFATPAAPSNEPWRQTLIDEPLAGGLVAGAVDPFADLPPSRPQEAREDHNIDGLAPSTDPQAAAPPAAPINPVGDIFAGAAAALGEAMVPRITIHAFCAQAEMAEMVKLAAADRRMERAQTVVRPGGLAGAVEHYQNQPTPSLVILESLDSAPELLALLGRLAEVCDPGTKVIVIGAANDIALYRELMRRGVSEYLVPPMKPLQLISAITSLYADPAAPFVGRQIAFCGAKGGCGASTLAHNVAHMISERMTAGTVLVDLDLAFGTAGLDFNQDPLQGIADALAQPDRLDAVLMDRMMVRCSEHLSLFAAPATLDKDHEISVEVFEEVTQKIRGAAPYVVLDMPHAWTPWSRRVLLSSDDVIVVTEPDLASLRNAKNMIDLIRHSRPNDAPPRVVLNRVGIPGRPEIPSKDFGDALGLAPALVIPFDAKLFWSGGQQRSDDPRSRTQVEGGRGAGDAVPADHPPRGGAGSGGQGRAFHAVGIVQEKGQLGVRQARRRYPIGAQGCPTPGPGRRRGDRHAAAEGGPRGRRRQTRAQRLRAVTRPQADGGA